MEGACEASTCGDRLTVRYVGGWRGPGKFMVQQKSILHGLNVSSRHRKRSGPFGPVSYALRARVGVGFGISVDGGMRSLSVALLREIVGPLLQLSDELRSALCGSRFY